MPPQPPGMQPTDAAEPIRGRRTLARTLVRYLLVALLLAAVVQVAWAEPHPAPPPPADADGSAETVRLATLEWPPYVGSDLPEQGFLTALVTTAFERAGYAVEVTFMPWPRVLWETEEGRVDAAFPAYWSRERAATYDLGTTIAAGPLGLYRRAGEPVTFRTVADLAPHTIGVVRRYVNTRAIDAAAFLHKEVVNSDLINLRMLLLGRIDLAVIDHHTARFLIEHELPPEARARLDPVSPLLAVKGLHVAFSRAVSATPGRRAAFDRAFREMVDDGTLDGILRRHLVGKTASPRRVPGRLVRR